MSLITAWSSSQSLAKHPWLIYAQSQCQVIVWGSRNTSQTHNSLPPLSPGQTHPHPCGATHIFTLEWIWPNNSSRVHTHLYSLPSSSFWELQERKRMHRILRISGSVINEKLSNRCGNYNALWDKVFNGTIQSTSRVFNPLELILHLLYYNWNGKT